MMMEAKKQALKDMMSMLKGEKQKKMQVMVAGNNPKAVKKGLETAEDVIEPAAEGMESGPMEGGAGMGEGKGTMMGDPQVAAKVDGMLAGLSMAEKKAMFEKLIGEMDAQKGKPMMGEDMGENDNEDEMC